MYVAPVNSNGQLIETFYRAFQQMDGATMASCYAPDATFTDEAFVNLTGREAGAMWKMLTGRSKDLKVEFSNVTATETEGSAHWEAWYTFSTGNKVHNVIEARFQFKDGKIIAHRDTFDFWRWSRQALGLPGLLLGWSGFLKKQVQTKARAQLDAFVAKNP